MGGHASSDLKEGAEVTKIRLFGESELAGRVERARAALREAGLDALLLFAQESHHFLTGYDTSGYVFFHARC